MPRILRSLAIAALFGIIGSIGAVAHAEKVAPTSPIDLNAATEGQLESLKGVGAATAAKIIAGRPYKSIDELTTKGIPQRTVDMIRPMVTVGGGASAPAAPAAQPAIPTAPPAAPKLPPAPAAVPAMPASAPAAAKSAPAAAKAKLAPGQKVNINTASEAELEALPGIGPVKAQKVIAARPFNAPEDIMKVSGIKQGTFAKLKDLIVVK